jgi:two-component system heavy metal sensor histidine kinase CusS
VNLRRLKLSLTLRLALLYSVSTLALLLGVAAYTIHAIDAHFIEQDTHEMRGKLELGQRLLQKAGTDGTPETLPWQFDDALIGHHHLALALYTGGQRSYAFGVADFPPALLAAAAPQPAQARLHSWDQNGVHYRGLALHVAATAGGPDHILAVAIETSHHRDFIDSFRATLWLVLICTGLVAAALGWAVARAGLAPLRQIAHLAGQINAERLHERLPYERVPPELIELATAFNAMLDRLKDSFERLSAFSADLAHEMRTPVSNLMMQTQVMLSQARAAAEYRDVLASNLEEYERLARTIADMLFLAKAENGLVMPSRETVDLAAEVAELFDFYEALADEGGVRLVAAGAARVPGDRLMLRRAVSNLLSNAIRHTPAGGTVEVRIGESDGYVVLAVENPGPPLAPEHLPRLFDRFYRADPARRENAEGNGLGLAITRAIVRAHGGEATAQATATGIRFELRLPSI